MSDDDPPYDIAVSFSGAQRPLVESYVQACEALGVRVFYDRNVTVQMWGRNFIYDFRKVYGGGQARYVVPFLSTEFLSGAYPMDEFNAAVVQAISPRDEPYLLPIVVGDVRVPEHLLSSAMGFLRMEDHSVEELARFTAERVLAAPAGRREEPAAASRVRLPGVPLVTFSEFGTLEAALTRVGERFAKAAPDLLPYGCNCQVRTAESTVDVRLEAHGRPIYGIRIGLSKDSGTDKLTVRFGWPRTSDSGIDAWVTARWDAQASEGKLAYMDISAASSAGSGDDLVSADDLFELLWHKIIDFIDQACG